LGVSTKGAAMTAVEPPPGTDKATTPASQDAERLQRQRVRNIAIALALGAMVVMFFVATLVRLGANVGNRPM
jgi:hypothetical protein